MKIKQSKKASHMVAPESIFEPRDAYPLAHSTFITITTTTKVNMKSSKTNLQGVIKQTKAKKKNQIGVKLSIKSIKNSMGNFFRPSKRIGRHQEAVLEKLSASEPIKTIVVANNYSTPTVEIPQKPRRSQVRTTSTVNPLGTDKIDACNKVYKPQPAMGIDMRILKAKTAKVVNKQWDAEIDSIIKKESIIKNLVPFLDNCDFDELSTPVNSTFKSQTFTIPSPTVTQHSPVSIKSKAKFVTVIPAFNLVDFV